MCIPVMRLLGTETMAGPVGEALKTRCCELSVRVPGCFLYVA